MKKLLALVILVLAVAATGVYLWLRADLSSYNLKRFQPGHRATL